MFFDKLRAGAQGTVSKIILLLIIVSFALAGVGSYVTRPAPEVAAVVNNSDISLQQLENAYRNERARLEEQLGPEFSALLNDPGYVEQVRRSVLEQLVEQQLIDQKVAELGIYASDEQVRNAIRTLPEFQEGGRFSNDRYQQLLTRSGISAEQLRDNVRQDLSRQLLLNALIGSSFTLEAEAGLLDRLSRQERDLEWVQLPTAALMEEVNVSEQEIADYYEKHADQFKRPEQVKIDYILLDGNNVSVDEVDEQAIVDEYEANIAAYSQPEQRKVAHIMLNKGEDAKQNMAAIQERLAAGESFSELAQAESDDVFSGANGGELEWMEPGSQDPAFDKAAFALTKVGEVSPIVESEFGLHLITLLDIKEGHTQPLAEVRDVIAAHLAKEQVGNEFYEQEQKLAELSFEFPDSLDVAAEELGVPRVSTEFFSQADAPAAINDPRVLKQAFSSELREQGMNSELIELGNNKAVVIHVTQHRAAAPRELEEVQEQVLEQARTAKAEQLNKEAAMALQAAWEEGKQAAWLDEHELNVQKLNGLSRESEQDPALLNALFAMPKPSKDQLSLQRITLSDGSQAVLNLSAVYTPNEASDRLAQIREGLVSRQGQREYESLMQAFKASANISYKQLTANEENF